MKKLIVETKSSVVEFNLPTNLKELSNDYLKQVTDSIIVAPNYSLIGLVYHEKLAPLILTCRNNKKTTSIGVVPIFIKSGSGDPSVVDKAQIGQKLLIANSSIERAFKCAAPANRLTLEVFADIIRGGTDKELYDKAISDPDQSEIYFVDFKIVPNCEIIALYDDVKKVESPFIKVTPVTQVANKSMVN